MIRLSNNSNENKFSGATIPTQFLGRYYIGVFGGGSVYSGTITHNLNKMVRHVNVLLKGNPAAFNYSATVMPSNPDAHAACNITPISKNAFNYDIRLIGNGGNYYYWVDLYGDDGIEGFDLANTPPA